MSSHAETHFESFTSSANTNDQETTLLTVDDGPGRIVELVKVFIPSAAGSAVDVRVFDGDSPVAPVDNDLDISGELVEVPAHAELSPGDTLVARHDNTSSTARTVRVMVVSVPAEEA